MIRSGFIISTSQNSRISKAATSYGISVGGAVGGGISLGIGFAVDATDNWGIYFSFSGNMGLGGGVGFDAGIINSVSGQPVLL